MEMKLQVAGQTNDSLVTFDGENLFWSIALDRESQALSILKLYKSGAQEFAKQFNTNRIHPSWTGRNVQRVPHHLFASKLNQRLTFCSSLKSRIATEPFLVRVTISKKKWFFIIMIANEKWQWLEPIAKLESISKRELRPKKNYGLFLVGYKQCCISLSVESERNN